MRVTCSIHAMEDCLERTSTDDGRLRIVCVDSDVVVHEEAPTAPATPSRRIPAAPVATDGRWERVNRWDAAFEQTFFDGRYAGRPVYLDVNEEELLEAADLVDASEAPEEALVDDVRAVLPTGTRGWLRPVLRRLDAWEASGREGTPPILATLAVLVLAAEHMRADEDMSTRNYYGRLTKDVLGLDDSARDATAAGYQAAAPRMFGALNTWLSDKDGALGLPTARPGGSSNKYVFYAISQALLREGDRHRLARFFDRTGLTAGTSVAIADMARLLEEHATRSSNELGQNLTRLATGKPDTRLRLAGLAVEELQDWDGTVPDRAATRSDSGITDGLRLSATIGGFPRPSLRLGLLGRWETCPTQWSASGQSKDTLATTEGAMRSLAEGWCALEPSGQPAWDAALAIGLEAEAGGMTLRRDPARVVVLRYEPGLSRWVEADRVVAGEDTLVLYARSAEERLLKALESCARPGWSSRSDVAGLPDGWSLVTDLQIMGAPADRHHDVEALAPSSHASLTLGGGLRLPEQPRRWHRRVPPEIRLSLPGHDEVRVHLRHLRATDGGETAPAWVSGPHPGVCIVSLEDHDLPAGDWSITVTANSSPEDDVLVQATMRLRDGRQLAVSRIGKPAVRLGYRHDRHGPYPVELGTDDDALEGARTTLATPGDETTPREPPATPAWVVARRAPRGVDLADTQVAVDPPSCFVDGAHRYSLDDATRGGGLYHVACSRCGKWAFFPTRPVAKGQWAERRQQVLEQMTASVAVSDLDDVTAASTPPDAVLDALTHLRDGTASQLDTVLRAGFDALEAAVMLRNLEALGHVEVERDARLQPVRWCVAPPVLALLPGTEDDAPSSQAAREAVLAGARDEALMSSLRDACDLLALPVSEEDQRSAPSRVSVVGPLAALQEMAELVRSEDHDLQLSLHAAAAAAALSMPMWEVLDLLPQQAPPQRAAVRRLDLRELAWKDAATMSAPGVYRVDLGYRAFQCLRTSDDITNGVIRTGPQDLVKHAAVAALGRQPYIAYREPELIAPSRVGLPGLLERAAVLCSGYVPEERTNGQRVYRDVPAGIARRITARITARPHAGEE